MPDNEYLIKLCKAAYYEYKIISRSEFVLIYEAAKELDPQSELFKIIKEFTERKMKTCKK